jgi:tRNA(Arg) A34 adenosine deaminase TadA
MLERWMSLALREAEKAFEKNEVPVGAVVLDSNGSVVGRGFNQTEMLGDATAHAEMIALTAAMATMESKYLQDCTLVVTLEPCPMCAGAILLAKVGRVVFGSYDAKWARQARSSICSIIPNSLTALNLSAALWKKRQPLSSKNFLPKLEMNEKITNEKTVDNSAALFPLLSDETLLNCMHCGLCLPNMSNI